MADTRSAALINLDTLVARPQIAIDGVRYDILSPDELSVIQSHRFGVWGRRIEALTAETGEAAEEELETLVMMVAQKICVGVPEDVFVKLPGSQRWAIIDVFTGLLLQNRLKVAGAMAAAMGEVPAWMRPLIGVASSPGSSGFTADARKTGWRRFLPSSSALS